jgi:hypothetical protein
MMAESIKNNKYLSDKAKRDAMILRNVIESSVFEGIYDITEADLQKHLPKPAESPRRSPIRF